MIQNVVLLGVIAASAYKDWKEKKVCVYTLFMAGIAGVVLHIIYQEHSIIDMLGGTGIGFAVLLVAILSKEKIGMGDGVMLVTSGIFLGFWGNLELLLTSLLLSGMTALFLLVLKKRKRNDRMPFLPFLLAAYLWVLI